MEQDVAGNQRQTQLRHQTETSDRYSIVLDVPEAALLSDPMAPFWLQDFVIPGNVDKPARGFKAKGRYYYLVRETIDKLPWWFLFYKTGRRGWKCRRVYQYLEAVPDKKLKQTDEQRSGYTFIKSLIESGLVGEIKV